MPIVIGFCLAVLVDSLLWYGLSPETFWQRVFCWISCIVVGTAIIVVAYFVNDNMKAGKRRKGGYGSGT
jgi:hypothetical protein